MKTLNRHRRRQLARLNLTRTIPWCAVCGAPIWQNSVLHRFWRNIPDSEKDSLRLIRGRTAITVCEECEHELSKLQQRRKVEGMRARGELQSLDEKLERKEMFDGLVDKFRDEFNDLSFGTGKTGFVDYL